MSLSTSSPSTAADHLMTARTRHQHELDAINQQLALFVHQYTQHIHHSLQALAPLTQRPSTSPAQPSLDDILPPPPKPKRKPINHHSYQHTPTNHTTTTTTTTTASITPAAVDTTVNSDSDQQYRDEEDEVERDAYGVLIKRRRSKLPLRSVLELRSWFAEHLQAPYPTDSQRDELAQRAQLTVKQVQNCQPYRTYTHADAHASAPRSLSLIVTAHRLIRYVAACAYRA